MACAGGTKLEGEVEEEEEEVIAASRERFSPPQPQSSSVSLFCFSPSTTPLPPLSPTANSTPHRSNVKVRVETLHIST